MLPFISRLAKRRTSGIVHIPLFGGASESGGRGRAPFFSFRATKVQHGLSAPLRFLLPLMKRTTRPRSARFARFICFAVTGAARRERRKPLAAGGGAAAAFFCLTARRAVRRAARCTARTSCEPRRRCKCESARGLRKPPTAGALYNSAASPLYQRSVPELSIPFRHGGKVNITAIEPVIL